MDATLTKDGNRYKLALARSLQHSPEKVWRVLTERDLLKQWFPCDVEGEWKVGAPLRFEFLHGEGEGLTEDQMRGEVLKVEPNRLLEFTWGEEVIRCELVPEGDGCRLLFAHTIDDASWGARNAAGWEMCLESLELVMQGATIAKFAWSIWRPKFEGYVKKFEPVFGPQDEPPEDTRADSE